MAALSWSSLGMLRCPVPLRSLFVWLVLVLLLTGAASYTHGSRYAIVPDHGSVQSTAAQAARGAPSHAETAATSADTSASAVQAPPFIQEAGPTLGSEEAEKECCERRQAPRSEPAPVRTGAVDPPPLTLQHPGEALPDGAAPPEPGLPALTVVELSISRT
jgi:hypothetical protein